MELRNLKFNNRLCKFNGRYPTFSSGAVTYWNGSVDTSWYNPNSTEINIYTPEQYVGLCAITDNNKVAGVPHDDFYGRTVHIRNDLYFNEDIAKRCLTVTPYYNRSTATWDHYTPPAKELVYPNFPNRDNIKLHWFRGTLDGHFHKISGFIFSSMCWRPCFMVLRPNAVVKNLIIENCGGVGFHASLAMFTKFDRYIITETSPEFITLENILWNECLFATYGWGTIHDNPLNGTGSICSGSPIYATGDSVNAKSFFRNCHLRNSAILRRDDSGDGQFRRNGALIGAFSSRPNYGSCKYSSTSNVSVNDTSDGFSDFTNTTIQGGIYECYSFNTSGKSSSGLGVIYPSQFSEIVTGINSALVENQESSLSLLDANGMFTGRNFAGESLR